MAHDLPTNGLQAMLKLPSKLSPLLSKSRFKLSRALPVAAVAVVAALTLNYSASASDLVIKDTFNLDGAGTPLAFHSPEQDAEGGGWTPAIGSDFRITPDGRGLSETGVNGERAIAVIDTLLTEYDAQVTFTRADGSSVIGGVFRYVDASNYFATYHDGELVKLVKVIGGIETVLDQEPLATEEVVSAIGVVHVRADGITVSISDDAQLQTGDSALHGSTLAGLLFQAVQTTSFRDFEVSGLSAAPGPEPTPEQLPAIVFDSFTAANGTTLPAHITTEVRPGGPWVSLRGVWTIQDVKATLAAPSPAQPFSDQIAVIGSGDGDDQQVSADITWQSGTAGIAWDVTDPSNYSIVFWDGFYLVAGRVDGGVFRERGRQSVEWASGETRTLTARVNDGNTRVYLNGGAPVMLAVGLDGMADGGSGIFARGATANTFDNFIVRDSQPLSQPDPELPAPDDGTGPGTAIPSDAWVFDSFDTVPGSQLSHRLPELDPSQAGWQTVSGAWQIADRQAAEQSGVYGPGPLDRMAVIDSGRDEYVIETPVEWDGGRVGVLFGGRASGPGDAGRNGFLFFRNGDALEVGKLIGGVYFPLDETDDFNWPLGARRTMKVVVEGGAAQMFLGDDLKLTLSDPGLAYSTWAGLFQRGRNDERFDNFKVSLPEGASPPPLVLTVAPVADMAVQPGESVRIPVNVLGPDASTATVSASALPPGDPPVVVYDSFDGSEPDLAPSGAAWRVIGAPLSEPTSQLGHLALPGAADGGDQRIVIDTRYSDMTVSAELAGQPSGRAGLVARHDGSQDDGDWVMGWMDFSGDTLLIGKSVDGVFRLLGVAPYTWPSSETREMSLSVIGSDVTLAIDGQVRLAASDSDLPAGTYAGAFTRGDQPGATFDNFTATASGLPRFMALEQTGGGPGLVVTPLGFDNGDFYVTFNASAGDKSASATFTLTVPEATGPRADAGGPYSGVEGQPLTLDASASTAGSAAIIERLWDVDGDGVTDLTGISPQFTPPYPGVFGVTLTVVDAIGLSSQATEQVIAAIAQPQIDLSGLFLRGDASVNGGVLSLTEASAWSGGAAWMEERQAVTGGFTATFDFTLSDVSGEPGADGLAFVLQSSPVGVEAIGLPGSGMGYELIENSLVIEFDNWANPELSETGPHIAVHSAGTGANGPGEAMRLAVAELHEIEMGATHTARIVYEPGLLRIYLDDFSTPALEVAIDISTLLDLPGGTAFAGFTAGTGGAFEGHEVSSFHFATES